MVFLGISSFLVSRLILGGLLSASQPAARAENSLKRYLKSLETL